MSRWYTITDSTTVGGDSDTATVCTVHTATITTNRAAYCLNISSTAPAALSRATRFPF